MARKGNRYKGTCVRGHTLPMPPIINKHGLVQRCHECDLIRNNLAYTRHRKERLADIKESRKSESKRAHLNAAAKGSRIKIKAEVFAKFGNRCNSPTCFWVNEDGSKGCTDTRCLQIDHVNDDGSSSGDRNLKSGYFFYKKVLEDTENRFQLLCSNCNWIKRYLCMI